MDDKNLHTGHRERVLKKFAENPIGLPEHELLEIFLFPVIPRRDVNPLAHELIRTFGGLAGVLKASFKELASVNGVGKSTAAHLVATGKIYEILKNKEAKKKEVIFSSFADCKDFLEEYFSGFTDEHFIVIFLNERYRKIAFLEYCDDYRDKVTGDLSEIAKGIALHKPACLFIAHNHPHDTATPSRCDDLATKKINALCSVHGVTLIDHVIVAKGDIYSYCMGERMEYIKETSDMDKILQGITE